MSPLLAPEPVGQSSLGSMTSLAELVLAGCFDVGGNFPSRNEELHNCELLAQRPTLKEKKNEDEDAYSR